MNLPSTVSSYENALAAEQEWRRRQALKKIVVRDPCEIMLRQGFDPDPWQREILSSTHNRLMMLCCRQSGKSTTAAAVVANTLFDVPGALVVLTSPSLPQSQEIFRKILRCYKAAIEPPAIIRKTMTELELANEARVVCKSSNADTIRSFSSVHTVIVDEAAIADDSLFTAVSPMLAVSRGRFILLSSAKGQRGSFWKWWETSPLWKKVSITADNCPRYTPEFLESELATMGPMMYEQEYFNVFLASLDQYFRTEDVDRAFSEHAEPGMFDAPVFAD